MNEILLSQAFYRNAVIYRNDPKFLDRNAVIYGNDPKFL